MAKHYRLIARHYLAIARLEEQRLNNSDDHSEASLALTEAERGGLIDN